MPQGLCCKNLRQETLLHSYRGEIPLGFDSTRTEHLTFTTDGAALFGSLKPPNFQLSRCEISQNHGSNRTLGLD